MQHRAFVVEAGSEDGMRRVEAYLASELGVRIKGNPDVAVLEYGLFTVEDARAVIGRAAQGAFSQDRALIIIAQRAYREAQNALLKLFEEPPPGLHLFLVLPTLGGLLPTLRSRVQVLGSERVASRADEETEAFVKATREKRSALIKQLTAGTDEEERRERRDEAIALVNGLEQAAYRRFEKSRDPKTTALLSDLATLRGYLHDRSAPTKMILEHLALVVPKDLL